MSGSLANQFVYPQYGQIFESARGMPPAISISVNWLSLLYSSAQPGIVGHPFNLPGVMFGYTFDLSQAIRPGVFPAAQSIYIDNTECEYDITVSVNETNVSFVAPAFSVGMYPLVAGGHPIITLSSLQIVGGTTNVFIFAGMLPPFITRLKDRQQNAAIATTGITSSAPFPQAIPPTTPTVITTGGFTPQLNCFYNICNAVSTGRFVLSDITVDIAIAITGTGVVGSYLMLCEVLQLANNAGYYYQPIWARNIILDGSLKSANGWYYYPAVSARFNPPYISRFTTNQMAPIKKQSQPYPIFPSLAWAVASAPQIGTLYINSAFTLDVVPSGFNYNTYSDPNG